MTRESEAARLALLERVPLLALLSEGERRQLAQKLEEVSYRRGEIIWREGDAARSFFVIASGEVEVLAGESERVLNRLGPGDFAGEMALLLDGTRSATVRAARALRLLWLDRASFDRHFRRNPKVLEHFAQLATQRLAVRHHADAGARRAMAICVHAAPGLRGRSLVAAALADFLAEMSGEEVLLVRVRSKQERVRPLTAHLSSLADASAERISGLITRRGPGPARLSLEADSGDAPDLLGKRFSSLLDRLLSLFVFVVIDPAAEPAHIGDAVAQASDHLVPIVSDPTGACERDRDGHYPVVNLFNAASDPVPLNRCAPYVLSREPSLERADPAAAVAFLRQHPETRTARSLRRLARKILGRVIGVAVGGGAAFGIAHVGILEVLEENDVEVDLLAGTSFGSIIAVGYAAGLSGREMHEIALRIGTVPVLLSALDFTLAKPGLLAGNRLIEIFSPLIGGPVSFEELLLPCQLVATDIRSGERVTLGSGRLDSAFRASCSVPMLWAPVERDGRILVDGAIVDPVPAQAVNEMGADVCIAVNVVPPLKQGIETVLTRAYRRLSVLNPLSYLRGRRELPNTFDVIMNSIQMLQHELGNFKAISADVRINPDLSQHTWVEFYKAGSLIERGMEAAERALPSIQRALAMRGRGLPERPAPTGVER